MSLHDDTWPTTAVLTRLGFVTVTAIERERRRLRRAFRLALVAGAAASAPTAMMACGSSDDRGASSQDGGVQDATLAEAGHDSGTGADTGPKPAKEGGSSPSKDAALSLDAFAQGGCYLTAVELDGGPEAAAAGLDTCLLYYGCGLPEGLALVGCNVLYVEEDGGLIPTSGLTCSILEEAGCTNDVFTPGDGGSYTMSCFPCPTGGGRRTAGLALATCAVARSPAGAYLAAMAFEERASVAAFARMRTELASMGAPRAMVQAAAVAGRDEVRHARVMARLARARGARVARARVRSVGARSLAAVAIENAVEGCVRETYGALVLAWQAEHADNRELRGAFARIARDEARHASLAWALAAWLEPRLDARSRARVMRARARAVARLEQEQREPPPSLAREAGLPTAPESRALLGAMAHELALTTGARRRSPRSAAPSP